MDEVNAQETLSYIKDMIKKTRTNTASSWKFLLLWGIFVIIAITGMYILVFLKLEKFIWINWVFLSVVASIIQIILSIKEEQQQRVKTYAQAAIAHLGFSGGIGYMLVGLVFPMLKLYPIGMIPILISILTGIMVFTIGGIIQSGYLKLCGGMWFLSSLIMLQIHWHYRALLFIPLIIISYLIPGFSLYKKYKDQMDYD